MVCQKAIEPSDASENIGVYTGTNPNRGILYRQTKGQLTPASETKCNSMT
jgi:hypothetical protein